ncbi:hypothetical protein [Janibacter indicus]|uniref:hypothetical protein n=1 Tax=Janibacter indicus TaxID=857417 RepID=UPI003EC12DD1
MRRLSGIVMSGALGVALVGIAAPAGHAASVEGSFEVVDWETQASCRNHGAPSPVVTYTVPSAVTSWRNILFAVDDQSGYARTALQEGQTTVTETLGPIASGEHVLREVAGGAQELTVTAPQCPEGSPDPTSAVFPNDRVAAAVVDGAFTEPTCTNQSLEPPVLPFDYDNTGTDNGFIAYAVDGLVRLGTFVSPGGTRTQTIAMDEGEHTYSLYGAKGELLDVVTVTAPDCTDDGSGDPGTDDPGTDDPGTDDPGTDDPGEGAGSGDGTDDGDGAGSGDGEDTGTDTPRSNAPTPEIPKVVHTG